MIDTETYLLGRHVFLAGRKAEPYTVRTAGGEAWASVTVGWWALGIVAAAIVGWPLLFWM